MYTTILAVSKLSPGAVGLSTMSSPIHVRIATEVGADLAAVHSAFTRTLLEKLNPPFPSAKLLRYDGEQPGDEVWIELHFILFKQVWKSVIAEQHQTEQAIYFVDKGVQLPFFLSSWQHKHLLESLPGGGTLVVDELRFTTPFWLPAFLAKPLFAGLMLYRRPIYKRVFRKRTRL